MGLGKLVPISILFTLGFSLFSLGLYQASIRFEGVPFYLWWTIFALVLFGSLFVAIYVNITLRIRKIQEKIEEHGMSPELVQKRNRTMTLEMLEEEVSRWSERQSQIVQELQGREQFRRDYIGNVSHELKTPIFNIQGYILTLLDGAMDDKKVAMKFLRRAAKSVDRMTSLIKDMDVLSKVESGHVDISMDPVILTNLMDDTLQGIESFAKKRGAILNVSYDIEEDLQVLCDPARIEQVLDNLLVNAIKYSDEGKNVSLKCEEFDEKVQITVKDEGFGIPEKDLGRIFERFYRVDKARSRDAGGSGLGLSIVKHIIDRHNETITVRSEEGVGTEFKFTLSKFKGF